MKNPTSSLYVRRWTFRLIEAPVPDSTTPKAQKNLGKSEMNRLIIPVAVPVSSEERKAGVMDLFPKKLRTQRDESNDFYNQISTQHEIYDKLCKQFVDFLGEEDFAALNSAPFWNAPKSEEYRSQFINSTRPIIRSLAQERLKLWDLLSQFSRRINAQCEILDEILNDPNPVLKLLGNQAVAANTTTFNITFEPWEIVIGSVQNASELVQGLKLNLSISTNHIIEDDEGIRSARIAKFEYERRCELVNFLKSLQKHDKDNNEYETPNLFFVRIKTLGGGGNYYMNQSYPEVQHVSIYDQEFRRDDLLVINFTPSQRSHGYNHNAGGYEQLNNIDTVFKFVDVLRSRNIEPRINTPKSITIEL